MAISIGWRFTDQSIGNHSMARNGGTTLKNNFKKDLEMIGQIECDCSIELGEKSLPLWWGKVRDDDRALFVRKERICRIINCCAFVYSVTFLSIALDRLFDCAWLLERKIPLDASVASRKRQLKDLDTLVQSCISLSNLLFKNKFSSHRHHQPWWHFGLTLFIPFSSSGSFFQLLTKISFVSFRFFTFFYSI